MSILVIAEHDHGTLKGATLNTVTAAGQCSSEVHVLVAGVNQVKKHQRPNPMKNEQGGIVSRDTPIHVSNVALWNPVMKKPDRIGIRKMEDGRKLRYYKSNGELVNA